MIGRIRHFHRALAIVLLAFILLHLSTHLMAFWGPDAHSAMLKRVRPIYRGGWIERGLLAAFALQIVLGIRLLVYRWPDRGHSLWSWLQIISGGIIAIFVVIHASAAVMARRSGIDTNFYWPAGTLVIAPLKYGFAPYYALAVSAVFVHLAAALHLQAGCVRHPAWR